MAPLTYFQKQILILANPKLRFKDDGETPKIWWGGDMARELAAQRRKFKSKSGLKMPQYVYQFVRLLILYKHAVAVGDDEGFQLKQAFLDKIFPLGAFWERRPAARLNSKWMRQSKQILSSLFPDLLAHAEMLDAQIEQHRVSESMDVDDQPGLSDPDAEMVDENYGDNFMPSSPTLNSPPALPPVTPRRQPAPHGSYPTPTSMNGASPVQRRDSRSAPRAADRATVDEDPFAPPTSNTSDDEKIRLHKKLKAIKTRKAIADRRWRTSVRRQIASKRAAREALMKEKKASGRKAAVIHIQQRNIEQLASERDSLAKRVRFWRRQSLVAEAKRANLQERNDRAVEDLTGRAH